MKHNASDERRCTECRARFQPALSAVHTQRVCCDAKCRASRRRKLARRRRERRLQDYRVDERNRQRESRKRRREEVAASVPVSAATGSSDSTETPRPTVPCHAPPSSTDPMEIARKMLEEWDRHHALSRATLERWIARFLRRSETSAGSARDTPTSPSRATLGS
jgi:hypothetical protein